MRMVTATANTMVDPSLARMVGRRSSGVLTASLQEGVPHAVHGPDEPGLVDVLAELPPDPGDVGVDDPPAGVIAVAPDAVHELVPALDDAGVARQGEEDLELERGERH